MDGTRVDSAPSAIRIGHSWTAHPAWALNYVERWRVGGRQVRGFSGRLNVGDGPVTIADARELADFRVASMKRGSRDGPRRRGPERTDTWDHCAPDSSILG